MTDSNRSTETVPAERLDHLIAPMEAWGLERGLTNTSRHAYKDASESLRELKALREITQGVEQSSPGGASGCGHVPAGYSCVTPGCSNGPAPEPRVKHFAQAPHVAIPAGGPRPMTSRANAYVKGIREGVDPVELVRGMLNYQIWLEGQHIQALERLSGEPGGQHE